MALKITVTGNELFDFLKVEPGVDDAAVTMALDAAKDEAHQFLNTDFSTTAEDGTVSEQEAPAAVKAWVFNRAAQMYENRAVNVVPDYKPLQRHRVYSFRGKV